jgi:hypothetical protein
MTQPASQTPEHAASELPHLPGLRSWRAVYVFVLGCYIAYVVVLAALSAWVA